jgi:hypothetical protein
MAEKKIKILVSRQRPMFGKLEKTYLVILSAKLMDHDLKGKLIPEQPVFILIHVFQTQIPHFFCMKSKPTRPGSTI